MAQSVKRRVALFVTCLVDQVAPEVGQAAVRLLEAAGCEVVFPAGQTCCGQPAYNAGFPDDALRLARHHVDVFAPYDTVVTPSGSCAAMVRHFYPQLLGADTALPPTFESFFTDRSRWLIVNGLLSYTAPDFRPDPSMEYPFGEHSWISESLGSSFPASSRISLTSNRGEPSG